MEDPNIEIILRNFLSLIITKCSDKRSFFKFNLIKGQLGIKKSANHFLTPLCRFITLFF